MYGQPPGYGQPPRGHHPPPQHYSRQPPPHHPHNAPALPPRTHIPLTQHTAHPSPIGLGGPPSLPPHTNNMWWTSFGGLSPQQYHEAQGFFYSADRNRSGSLSYNELSSLKFYNRPIGIQTAKMLIKAVDKDKNNQLTMDEFLPLWGFISQMSVAFYNADRDHSWTLDWREIRPALQQAGFNFSDQTIQALVAKYDKSRKGILTFADFLLICANLAYLKSTFQWLDRNRSGTITINLEQLVLTVTDATVT